VTHREEQHDDMDITDCHDGVQLNICDDAAVDRLCADLSCAPTDVYQAVAFVGDRLCCVNDYVRRNAHRHGAPRHYMTCVSAPLAPSAQAR